MTLAEAQEQIKINERIDRLMSAEDYSYYLEAKAERDAELAAERYYENRGWMEAMNDEYMEYTMGVCA